MTRDTKQGDDLNMLKIELNNKIKDDLEKVLLYFVLLISCTFLC